MFSLICSIMIWIALFSLFGFGIYKFVLYIKDKKKRKEKGGAD